MNTIQDVPVAEYAKRTGIENQLAVRHLGDGAQVGTLTLDKAWIYTPLWAPITKHATTSEDFFNVYAAAKHNALYKPETLKALETRTKAGVKPANDKLAFALGGDANYWHFVKDFAARLFVYFELGLDTPLLVPPSFDEKQHALVKQIFEWQGAKLPPILQLGDEFAAVGPTVFPSTITIPAAVKIWEGRLKPPQLTDKSKQRLFVMRGTVSRRRLLNEEAVAKRLGELGFTCVDPGALSFKEQVALFQSASVVVGVHGAALANLLFAPPEGALVELTPDGAQPFYRDLALAKKWKIAQLAVRPEPGLGEGAHRDFVVDLALIERAVTPLL